jgi:NAD(P)-dependent dehydrogenase (short-subunit alcohol dehydrogenase family)
MDLKGKIKRGISFLLHGEKAPTYAKISYISPNHTLDGKKIIITGGGRGLGFAMAKKFVKEGATVLIAGRNEQTLKESSNKLGCKYLRLDVSSVEEFDQFLQEAYKLLGGLDCLVNNAGVSLHESDYTKVTPDTFDQQISINLKGSFFLTQKFIEKLKSENKNGVILFTSSETGETVDERPYGWTKAAINSMVQGLAYKLAKEGFRINAVAPGITASDMTGLKADGNIYYTGNIIDRVYMPEEVAETAAFLLSDASGCLNGQILVCNNGKTINARWK